MNSLVGVMEIASHSPGNVAGVTANYCTKVGYPG
jgi:hypothetical protein